MKLFNGQIYPSVEIHEDEQQHIIKVLRMRDGQELFVTDGQGNLAKGSLKIEGKKAVLTQIEIQEKIADFSPKLHIAIAPTKNIDRVEFFIEKATELGISEITFINTDNSERKNINIDKIRKQSISASKQSLRTYFPKINDLTKLKDFLKTINPKKTFVAHCDNRFDRKNLQDIEITDEITILIGPEGDFSENEIISLIDLKIKSIKLGNQRLRTETAGIYASAWVYFQMKN